MTLIIKQPDGRLAVFSDGLGRWLDCDMTEDEVAAWYAAHAAATGSRTVRKVLRQVLAGRPEAVYGRDALTFDQANDLAQERGGMVLDGRPQPV